MEKPKFAWFDGKLRRFEEVKLSLMTHALHYGSSVFEGIGCYDTPKGPAIFRLQDHMRRFLFSAEVLGLEVPYDLDELVEACKEVIRAEGIREAYIRPVAFLGDESLGLHIKELTTHVAIFAVEFPKPFGAKAIRVRTVSVRRISPQVTVPEAKIGGHYVSSILALKEAREMGYDDALLLDVEGYVAEGPGANVFFVKGNVLVTPKLGSILPGITRDTVMRLARDMGFKVVERRVTLVDAYDADEAFFCGTAMEVTPVASIDGKVYEKHDVTMKIREAYLRIVRGQDERYIDWLTFV